MTGKTTHEKSYSAITSDGPRRKIVTPIKPFRSIVLIFTILAATFSVSAIGGGGFIPTLTTIAQALGIQADDKRPSPKFRDALTESVSYNQGFEVDGTWADPPSGVVVNRVASGTDGIPSASGGYHGKAVSGNYTRWGGYSSTFPANGFVTSVDIYLDVNGGFTNDSRFDFTSALSNVSGDHLRDYVFNCGFYDDAGPYGSGNRFVCSASNNSGGFPRNAGRDPVVVTEGVAGWYTFRHHFYDSGAGVLGADLSIVNSAGAVVKKWTLINPTDVIGVNVGGNRYGWFPVSNFPFLAIDNSYRADISPANVVQVRPESLNQWLFYNDENDTVDMSLGSWVNGPGSVPNGSGSVEISVSGTQRRNLATYQFSGTPLADINEFRYSTYNPSAGNGGGVNRSGYANLNIDFDGSDTWQRRIIFVPSENGTVQQDTWQEWDMIAGGNALWKYSGTTWPAGVGGGGEPGSTQKTWNQILNQYPGVRVRVTDAHFGIRVGEPYASGYTENIDSVTFGTAAQTTIFDFEPTQIQMVDDDGFASATDCDDAGTAASTTVAAAVAAANPGDTIRVCPGTYPTASTIALNKAGLTIISAEATRPVLQIATPQGYIFSVTGTDVTIDSLEIQKTDLGTQHDLIFINGDNFTAQNNLIYGPDPGGTWDGTGLVSRAFEAAGGRTGININNNVIHTLRQPGYMNASTGQITNNTVSGTKGWVIAGAGAVYDFQNNTWGEPQNQGCDIALLSDVNPANYPSRLAMSAANNNAFICAQYPGGEDGRGIAYVDSSASMNGSSSAPYSTIQAGIDGALTGGTVQVAAGTYVEEIIINKTLSVVGPNAGINPNTGARGPEAIIQPASSNPIDPGFAGPVVVGLTAPGVTFDGFTIDGDNPGLTSGVIYNGADVDAEFGIAGGGGGSAAATATIINNVVQNIGEVGVYLYDFGFGGPHLPSTFQYNKIDNVPGSGYGMGAIFAYNAYTDVLDNVVTRAGIGIVTENINRPNAGAATSISNNSVSAHVYGIRVNTQSGYVANGWTVSNNNVTSYIESYVRPNPVTRFNGIRLESLQQTIPLTVSNNTITPDRTALVGNGYTSVEGIYITNNSTVTPNITITENTISNAIRGISHTTPAVPNVTCNLITNNDTGVYVGTDLGFGGVPSSSTNGINVNNNNIVGNTSYGVQNDSAFVANAENNYWGAADGPSGAGPGTGDSVSANVDFSPFANAPTGCAVIPTTVSISGTVSPAIAGVTVTLSGDHSDVAVTDGAGNYTFSGLTSGGNYLVTPSQAGYNFDPTSRNYTTLITDVSDADFARFAGGSQRVISVVSQNVVPGAQAVVPITLLSQGDENALGFSISYDPSVLSNPVVALGADSGGGSLIVNDGTLGQLGVVVARPTGQTYPASPPARQLVTITFDTTSTPPAFSTPLTFTDTPVSRAVSNANADELPASYSSGAVTFATGFESDVAPRFSGSNTGIINALDHSQTGRFAANLDAVNPLYNEFQRADAAPRSTRGNGSINAIDYSQAGRYAAGLDTVQSAGGPAVASLFSLAEAVKRSDEALFTGTNRSIFVEDKMIGSGTSTVTMSVKLEAQGDEGAIGFTLSYDQAILANPVVLPGVDASGANMVVNTVTDPGRIGVVMDIPLGGTIPAGTRELITVQFTVLITPTESVVTPIGIPGYPPAENVVGNGDDTEELPTSFVTGNLTILAPTAAGVSVGGQVLSSTGSNLGRVQITLTDAFGNTRMSLTNPFGYYRFDDVVAGATYMVQARAKGHTFAPIAVTIQDQITNLDIIANP